MKCKDVERLIPGYTLNELPGKEYEEVQAHLEQCPTCHRRHEAARQAIGLMRADEGTAPATWRRSRVMEAVKAEMQRHAADPSVLGTRPGGLFGALVGLSRLGFGPSLRWRLVLGSTAAMLVVTATLVTMLVINRSVTQGPAPTAVLSAANGRVEVLRNATTEWVAAATGEKLMPGDRVSTRDNSFARLDFADGLSVDLDSLTRIQVGMADASGRFSVVNFFHGKAWFEVEKSRLRDGLLIYAPGGVVKAAHARFEVSY